MLCIEIDILHILTHSISNHRVRYANTTAKLNQTRYSSSGAAMADAAELLLIVVLPFAK